MRFPLNFVPSESWHVNPRKFGAPRGGGRKHAGCDLYADAGTPVFAVADGTVKGFAAFYKGTFALTIDHGVFWVRYGEVAHNIASGLGVGTKVKEGDQIGVVGDLIGIANSMVHFEMYSGTASGPLTVPGSIPYRRRADLLDPTKYLDEWADAVAGAGGPTVLRFGSKGEAVSEWQRRLLEQGYAIAVDGDFGPTTEAATKEFQREADLAVDGVVGSDTLAAMALAEID